MNRYSKINITDTNNRSRSTDLFPQTPRKSTSTKPNPQTSRTHESTPKNTPPPEQEVDDDEVNGKRFGEVLSRARSVSSSAARTPSSPSTTPRMMHCAMKRALSMRRSASVSEGYSRIHDRSVSLASPVEDDEEGVVRSGKKKDKRGKILKVCKRLFGLY